MAMNCLLFQFVGSVAIFVTLNNISLSLLTVDRYQFLEYMCTKKLKYEANSPRFVSTKLLADTILFGPLHLLAFFLYMGLAAGKPFVQVKQDIHRDYLPTLCGEALFWMCVQVSLFSSFPPCSCIYLSTSHPGWLPPDFEDWLKWCS